MKLLNVGCGRFSMVDDEDFEKLKSYSWQSYSNKRNIVVVRKRLFSDDQNNPKKFYLHRVVMNAKRGQIVDHIDGNCLNNQKANLRICTQAENSRNTRSRIGSSSKFLGVSFRNFGTRCKWISQFQMNGKSYHIGEYDDEKEAALAYNVAASFAFREFARLNKV